MKACVSCGAEFTPKRIDQRFCSKPCNRRFFRDSDKPCAAAGCDRRQRAKDLCITHYNRKFHAGSQRLWPTDPEKRRVNLRAKTQRRRAAVRGGRKIERFTDVEIFERDGWCCGICKRSVDKRLKWPHPRSASLDHIVPLSEDPDGHRRANVRCAHLSCNMERSNRGGGEQLMLVG